MSVFKENHEVIKAKGNISFWLISAQIGIHENTLRNWMKSEMSPKRKKIVLHAINKIKKNELQEVN
ncbi:hypothetical protein BLX88_25890 [Bacillus obstructivus]|nr:hypothetical protein BLX88_25890 [Bacillus obstructivus]